MICYSLTDAKSRKESTTAASYFQAEKEKLVLAQTNFLSLDPNMHACYAACIYHKRSIIEALIHAEEENAKK